MMFGAFRIPITQCMSGLFWFLRYLFFHAHRDDRITLPRPPRVRPVSLRTDPRTMSQKTATDPMQLPPSGSAAPAELVAFSARLGRDETLVQGGGGNTSLKRDDDFWVKASGTWLAQAETRDVFVRLPLARVRTLMAGADAESALAALAGADGLRPSIETSLHALLPHPVVAHVHSVNAIAWAVRPDAEAALARALEGLAWAWVPYRRPGLPLTEAIRSALAAATAPPDILLLANHGLVVGGGDCATAEARLREVEHRLALPVRAAPAPDPDRLQAVNDAGWTLPEDPLLHTIGTDSVTCGIAVRGTLYPDHVVFLGERAAVAGEHHPLSRVIADAAANHRDPPVYAVVPGAGVLVSPALSDGARAMLGCLAQVGLRSSSPEAVNYLDIDDVAALIGWEAEAYRLARDHIDAAAGA